MVLKELVRARLPINSDMGLAESTIVFAIHDVLQVGSIMLVFTSIEHRLAKFFVLIESLEPWDEWCIGKSPSWPAF